MPTMGATHASRYEPRRPEASDAVSLVAEHLEDFAARAEDNEAPLPRFAVDELQSMVRCGDFEHGFVRFNCRRCGDELRVPFSCKARGTCPSCMGRRMCETAALWVERLLPTVGYRQWVLSFDGPMAVRLGYDAGLLREVCRVFTARLSQQLRRRAKRHHGRPTVSGMHAGVITVVQRFRSDLGLYVHLHCLVADGVFEEVVHEEADAEGERPAPVFLSLPEPTDEDLVAVLRAVASDRRLAEHIDLGEKDVDAGISACVQLGLATVSPQAGSPRRAAKLNVHAFGMNLHAATTVDGRDRKQLERLSRYLLRPPFATDAIQRLPEGRVRLDIARRGRSVVMSAEQFIAKLIALVPPPGVPMVRYAGVFSNAHHLRAAVAPAPSRGPCQAEPAQTRLLTFTGRPVETRNRGPATPAKIAWAQLLARVFAIDVLTCPRPGCGGKLRATAAVLQSREIALLLHGARGPPRPSPPGQLSFLNFDV